MERYDVRLIGPTTDNLCTTVAKFDYLPNARRQYNELVRLFGNDHRVLVVDITAPFKYRVKYSHEV